MNKNLPIAMTISFLLAYSFGLNAQIQIGADIDGTDTLAHSGRSVSLSSDGSTVAIGAPFFDESKGKVRVYKNQNGDWEQIGSDIEGTETGDFSGTSVSLSSDGSILAIGSYKFDGFRGQVRLYENQNGTWEQIGADIVGTELGDRSGISVSLSLDGSIVAIGALGHNDYRGQVRIYKNESGSWEQIGSEIEGAEIDDYSGWSVSLSSDGSTVAIGAPFHYGTTGRVLIYKNENGSWEQVGSDIDGTGALEISGLSVSLSSDGSTVAIGSPNHDGERGLVRVFKNQGGIWEQVGSDLKGKIVLDKFGYSVSLSFDGNILAIGIPNHNGKKGQVRVYKNQNETWEQIGFDISGAAIDRLGWVVSLSSDGSMMAIGVPSHNGNGVLGSGQVKVYNELLVSLLQIEENDMSIYPNPTSGVIQIEGIIADRIEVLDNLGRLLMTKDHPTSQLDISHLPIGVYYFKIKIGEKILSTQVIKN